MGRALVLGGGGAVGMAWQTGLLAGLTEAGLDLASADRIVGTSAGSSAGARLALGHDMRAVVAQYRSEQPQRTSSAARSGEWLAPLMKVMADAAAHPGPPEEGRAAIGRFALEAPTAPEERFVEGFSYLGGSSWPAPFVCTAVDAHSGEFVVWSASSGVPLDRAVASSCAVPGLFPPVTIDGRRYMDGGMRSSLNADLASGHETVLVVALSAGARAADSSDPRVARALQRLEEERRALVAGGASLVEVIGPDDQSAAAIGRNVMDTAATPAAAAAGLAQGRRIAGEIAAAWDAAQP